MKILLCLAGSESLIGPARLGAEVAGLLDGPIETVTVVDQEHGIGETAVSWQTQLARIFHLSDTAVALKHEQRVIDIVAECRAGAYDLIVVAPGNLHGLAGAFTRGVTRRVTEQAPVSVLVAKDAPKEIKDLLICTGGQDYSEPVVAMGLRLAAAAGAAARVLFVADPIPQMYTGLDDMEETLDELLTSETLVARHLRQIKAQFAAANVPLELVLRRGLVVDEILQESEDRPPDLIVIGASHQHGFWQELLLGKVTRYVVDRAAVSVMVVRP